jgi:iron complex outermembrane receptor protein
MPSAASNVQPTQPAEIVVTGQKRSQTLKEVPATVNVLTSDAIKRAGVQDLQGLNRLIPGFQLEMGAGGNMTLAVRGIGTTSSAQSFEQSVAPYINGVYLGGNNRDFSWPLFDVKRIEIYKGTQSGIQGQNTSAGVINIVTETPGDTFGGYALGGVEFVNHGYHLEGAVDIPASSTFKVRITGYDNLRGGWIKNVLTGRDLGKQHNYAGRVTARWDITPDLHLNLYGEYDHEKQIGSATSEIDQDPTGGYAAYIAPFLGAWRPNLGRTAMLLVNVEPSLGVTFGGDSGVLAHSWKGSAALDYNLGGGYTLTSITSASQIKDLLSVDQDFSPATLPTVQAPAQSQLLLQTSRYHQFTEELRLSSPTSARFNYIVGLWYRHAQQAKTTAIFIAPAPGTLFNIHWPFKATTNNASIFADATYRISDVLKLGGSLRYTHENKPSQVEGLGNFVAPFPPFPLFKTTIRSSFLDGSARLQYEPSGRLNFYALYSHGTKTGALVDLVASGKPQVVKPEVIQTYELGAKVSVPEARLYFDVAAFYMPIKNYQDSFTSTVNGFVLFTAANTDVHTKGIDASVQWMPVDGLTLNGTLEFLDAEDVTRGGTFVRSPKLQFTAGARYEHPINSLDAKAAIFANIMHKGSYYDYPPGNPNRFTATTPAYDFLDVGAELTLRNDLSFELLCKNCTNTYAYIRSTNGTFGPLKAPGIYHYIPELRTVTLQATYRFR